VFSNYIWRKVFGIIMRDPITDYQSPITNH